MIKITGNLNPNILPSPMAMSECRKVKVYLQSKTYSSSQASKNISTPFSTLKILSQKLLDCSIKFSWRDQLQK